MGSILRARFLLSTWYVPLAIEALMEATRSVRTSDASLTVFVADASARAPSDRLTESALRLAAEGAAAVAAEVLRRAAIAIEARSGLTCEMDMSLSAPSMSVGNAKPKATNVTVALRPALATGRSAARASAPKPPEYWAGCWRS